MTEHDYKNGKDGFLDKVDKRIEEEIGHIQTPTRKHVLKIVDEVARNYFPIGNISVPVHDDYYGDMDLRFDNALLSQAVAKDDTSGWDGTC